MPDNANAPGSALGSVGSPDPAGKSAPADPNVDLLNKILKGQEALNLRLEAEAKARENLRSLHDRQMTELRQSLQGGGRARQVSEEGGEGEGAPPALGTAPRITARELEAKRDNAIIRFRMEHPDWQEFWTDIEAIGSDSAKAKRFVRYTSDPDTGELVPDFLESLVSIREHLELQRRRAASEAATPANQQAAQYKAQSKADASAIGGSSADIPSEQFSGPAWAKLPYNEKVKKLVEAGVIEVDPRDPPGALREG